MHAIKDEKLDNVNLLLNHGADVEKTDNEGDTFLALFLNGQVLFQCGTELLLSERLKVTTYGDKHAAYFTDSLDGYNRLHISRMVGSPLCSGIRDPKHCPTHIRPYSGAGPLDS